MIHKILEGIFITVESLLFITGVSYVLTLPFATNTDITYWNNDDLRMFTFIIIFIIALFSALFYFSYERKE
jgi:hypothetical protein